MEPFCGSRSEEDFAAMFAPMKVLACLAVTVSLCRGQISSGTVAGSVQDPTGAVVPNAEVTIKQLTTGESRVTRTNGDGEFNASYLQPGEYSITATATGFKAKTLNNITLQVDQKANLLIILDVG